MQNYLLKLIWLVRGSRDTTNIFVNQRAKRILSRGVRSTGGYYVTEETSREYGQMHAEHASMAPTGARGTPTPLIHIVLVISGVSVKNERKIRVSWRD